MQGPKDYRAMAHVVTSRIFDPSVQQLLKAEFEKLAKFHSEALEAERYENRTVRVLASVVAIIEDDAEDHDLWEHEVAQLHWMAISRDHFASRTVAIELGILTPMKTALKSA